MANPYFNAEYYLSKNPDVFAAGVNTAEAAWEHYVNFGAVEALNGATSRKPAPWFDINFYIADNTDLVTAGLSAGQLFEHFINFGMDEGRQPSADAVITEESLLAYAKANEDLLEAFDIDADAEELTDEQTDALLQQFYAFGYKEPREGKPFDIDDSTDGTTFNLTTGVDTWTGTAQDDVANAIVDFAATANKSTLNTFDTIDGAGGQNTLNIVVSGTDTGDVKVPTGASVKNFQSVNVINNGSTVAAAGFVGAAEIWQSGTDGNISGLKNGQVAGFKGTDGATVTAAKGTTELNVVLDKVANSATFTFASADTTSKVTTVSVDGSGTAGSGAGAAGTAGYKTGLTLDLGTGNAVTTLNLGLTGSNVDLSLANSQDKLVTFDAADSTAGIWLDAEGATNDTFLALKSIIGGSGNDTGKITLASFKAADVAVDLGAGNDTLYANVDQNTSSSTAATLSLTGGSGDDLFALTAGKNVVSVASNADLAKSLVTITDFGTGADVLSLKNGSFVKVGADLQLAINTAINNLASDATLLDAANAAFTAEFSGAPVGNNGVFTFEFGGNTYVAAETSGGAGFNAGDTLIQLTGDDLTLDTTTFVVG